MRKQKLLVELKRLLLITFIMQYRTWAPGNGFTQDQTEAMNLNRIGKFEWNTAIQQQCCPWNIGHDQRKIVTEYRNLHAGNCRVDPHLDQNGGTLCQQ